ncbi:MAG: DNA-binding protein [Ignavibacteria bacterium]|nr:DNA-binding protein [Ignavibacteria bacterium]
MNYLGNKEILNNHKIGFLCSRKVPADSILKTYDWAIKQRDEGKCIISGFHSKIEKDVFEILLKGKQPIILILARSIMKRWTQEIIHALERNRLLIISPFDSSIKRITTETAAKRNELLITLADEIFIPYQANDGIVQKVISAIANQKIITYL